MKKLISCEYNIDTGNVECRFSDGSMLSIICEDVEDSVDAIASLKVRSELNWLVYEAPTDSRNKAPCHRRDGEALCRSIVCTLILEQFLQVK